MGARFTKIELSRAVEAFKAAGLHITACEIAPDGTIRASFGDAVADDRASQPIDLVKWKKTK